jgi:UDP:flavonoid glycosyltransferase YjiC (YdhE family)
MTMIWAWSWPQGRFVHAAKMAFEIVVAVALHGARERTRSQHAVLDSTYSNPRIKHYTPILWYRHKKADQEHDSIQKSRQSYGGVYTTHNIMIIKFGIFKRTRQLGQSEESDQMKFLIVTLDAGGNQPPAVGIGQELKKRGHTVRILGNAKQRSLFEEAGLTFRTYERTPEPPMEKVTPERVRHRMTQVETAYDVRAELERESVDAVILDCLLLSGLAGAEASGVKIVVLAHTLYAMIAPFAGKLASFLAPVRDALGLQPLTDDQSPYVTAEAILVTTLQQMEPPGLNVLPQTHWVGPVLNKALSSSFHLPELKEAGAPWILVGFSTGIIDGAVATMRKVLRALSPLDVRILVSSVGMNGADLEAPANAIVLPYVPHAEVMDKMSLVISHAGHGTVMAALSRGVPQLCLPMVNDEPLVAERLASLGASLTLSPQAEVEEIRSCVLKMFGDPSYKTKAQQMSSIMKDGAENSADQLEQLVHKMD